MGFTDIERKVDIVFCIDGTGSMSGCIDKIKENAKRFKQQFFEQMVEKKANVSSLRVRLVTFRDYGIDADPMEMTDFFELPDDQDEFESALAGIDAHGGGDAPENGFEALYYAMKSDWNIGPKDRQVIVLFTDADALELKERADESCYPADMVDKDGLLTLWSCASQDAGGLKLRDKLKRLVVYAPAGTKYQEFCNNVRRAWYVPVNMDAGLEEINFDDIISMLVASASAQ